MSRYRAAFYHFLISLAVFIALAYLVIFHWYPDFFFSIDGGWEGMRIIIGVDLVLGPCLTMIVFKSGKPGLKTDLSLIGLFQFCCLMAGVYIVYNERPAFFIYYERHFYSINQNTFTDYNLAPADPADFNAGSPAKIYIKLPDNAIEEADIRRILYQDGVPLWLYTPLFEPLEPNMPKIIAEGFNYDDLIERDLGGDIPAWIDSHGGQLEDYAFFPIHSRYRDAFLAINKSNLKVIDILEVAPPMSSSSES
jgi:hypothetical protein